MNFKIYGGTLKSHEGIGLCETCRCAKVTQGPAIWDAEVMCYAGSQYPVKITRPVWKCNKYLDEQVPFEHALEKTAWVLIDDGHGHLKFCPPPPPQPH